MREPEFYENKHRVPDTLEAMGEQWLAEGIRNASSLKDKVLLWLDDWLARRGL